MHVNNGGAFHIRPVWNLCNQGEIPVGHDDATSNRASRRAYGRAFRVSGLGGPSFVRPARIVRTPKPRGVASAFAVIRDPTCVCASFWACMLGERA